MSDATDHERRLIEDGDKLADELSTAMSDDALASALEMVGDPQRALDEWERVSGEIDPRL